MEQSLPGSPDETYIIDYDNVDSNITIRKHAAPPKKHHNRFVIESCKIANPNLSPYRYPDSIRYEDQINNYRFIRNGERLITDNIKYVSIGNIISRLVIDNISIFHDNIREITFGPLFNSELIYDDVMILPPNLKNLYLGDEYNKPFIIDNKKVLPQKLRCLRIGIKYNHPLIINDKKCLPKFLTRIHLTDCKMNIQYCINGKTIFPKLIKSIHFPDVFNEPLVINGVKIIPDGTQHIKLGNTYNLPFVINNIHVLPSNLGSLITGNNYNQPIIINNTSVFNFTKLRRLIFGDRYNQPIKFDDIKGIPDFVEYINLGISFFQPITENIFPKNMKKIFFGSALENHELWYNIRLSRMTGEMISAQNKNILSMDIFNNNIECIEFPLNDDCTIPISNFSSDVTRKKKIKIIMRYQQYINCLKYDPTIFSNKDVIIIVSSDFSIGNTRSMEIQNAVTKIWNDYITNYVLLGRIKYSSLKIIFCSQRFVNYIYPINCRDITQKLKFCEEIIDILPIPIADEIIPHIDIPDISLF